MWNTIIKPNLGKLTMT